MGNGHNNTLGLFEVIDLQGFWSLYPHTLRCIRTELAQNSTWFRVMHVTSTEVGSKVTRGHLSGDHKTGETCGSRTALFFREEMG